MEIETKNGSKIRLQEPSDTVDFGRGLGFNSSDQTVSRRHISFKLHNNQTSVYFEVKGKNPVWVHHSTNDKIRVYKRSETGELKSGDSFCVSSKNPVWFNLKKIASEDDDDSESKSKFDDVLAESSGSGIDYEEIESVDVSHIDPVKEFNFIVMGHEFDSYPKNKIRDIRNWDWFLDEAKEESDEDETNERKPKRGISKKRKKRRGKDDDDDDDDVWTGESEEDAEMIKKLKNVPKPKYSTRSKNQEKNKKGSGASKSAKDTTQRYAKDDEDEDDDDDDDDDEDDETLGGFIVDDEDIREGNDEDEDEDDEEEEEEEEFDEDDDE